MRLATLDNGTKDGQLIIVSDDGARYQLSPPDIPTLQSALEVWSSAQIKLREISDTLNACNLDTLNLDLDRVLAPLPRAWQWLDGSVYRSHAELMAKVIGKAVEDDGLPLMYQGMSDTFYSWRTDIPFPSTDLGIDFEGEFGVIVDDVPMGISADDAEKHIKLIVQINDWSLRALAGPEMHKGFGWLQAKPACSMAPFAITPDELGQAWQSSQVQLRLNVEWNDNLFGRPHGGQMEFGFNQLISHAARTRDLCAGTIIGSGTVSNPNFRQVGSTCIAERRGIEIIDSGAPKTEFCQFGDVVKMEATHEDGRPLFGAIQQKVVKK